MSSQQSALTKTVDLDAKLSGQRGYKYRPHRLLSPREIQEVSQSTCLRFPPLWGLRDLVAVNPFLGYSTCRIEDAHMQVARRLGAKVLPSLLQLREHFEDGLFSRNHIERALAEISASHSKWRLSIDDVLSYLTKSRLGGETTFVERYFSLAAWVDLKSDTKHRYQEGIITDISRFLAARYDEGIAKWNCLQSDKPLFAEWLGYARTSHAMSARGVRAFKLFVRDLPDNPEVAITQMVNLLGISSTKLLEDYSSALLAEIPGWTGYLRQLAWQHSHTSTGELLALLAIRMTYDVALCLDQSNSSLLNEWYEHLFAIEQAETTVTEEVQSKYILLYAAELAYRDSIQAQLLAPKDSSVGIGVAPRASAQVVLCIDVRSEILQRHIRLAAPSVETYGFAGFFGLPVQLVELDGTTQPQCPVLLKPSMNVVCTQSGKSGLREKLAGLKRDLSQQLKHLSSSAVANFTYVETIGFVSFLSMLGDLLNIGGENDSSLTKQFELTGVSLEEKTTLAAGVLKHLGLNQPYARLVLLCGHKSESANNPQVAGLACGACAGHSGESNARVASALLNDSAVREALSIEGWSIPSDTLFVGGVHNTATDEITILDNIPASHLEDVRILTICLQQAGQLVREERATRLGLANDKRTRSSLLSLLKARSKDISEVRPEWALAGNAAFIAATTERLKSVNLGGRSFLHNYNAALDPEGVVLETILTAPVVVASWINLQYFASSVDHAHFGSGLKTIHNISAGVGVVCGNDGDLAVGLSWQSVHDGEQFQHQPLRLQVFIEADTSTIDRILHKHASVRELVENEWILLYNISPDGIRRCRKPESWYVTRTI